MSQEASKSKGRRRGTSSSSKGGRPLVPLIHGGGQHRLDAITEFVKFAVRPMPLTNLLDEAPKRLASIVGADIASLYLLEGEGDELVMRGNVGFPERALGQVRLNVGEGITGTVIECLRPISVTVAQTHQEYRYFPELGEERFPVLASVPILSRAGALGAVTVQRRGQEPFSESDIELLVALCGSISAAIRHAELLDTVREKSPRKAGGSTRKVTLTGRPLSAGRALGALVASRRPSARDEAGAEASAASDAQERRLRAAFDATEKRILALQTRAEELALRSESSFLDTYAQIVADARLRGRAYELLRGGVSTSRALGQVAREATRAAAQVQRDAFLEERARDIEDVCDAVVMLACADPRAALPSKAILMSDELTVFDLLISARSQLCGLALSERAKGPRLDVLARLLGVPTLVDIAGIFRWASDGDVALLDADHGLLVINPSRSEIALLRRDRRPAHEVA